MTIDPTSSSVHLRLVRPADAVPARPKTAVPTSAPSAADAARQRDGYDFQSVYAARLPRVPWTDAHARLEKIRNQLVAARVNMPIHFDESRPTQQPSADLRLAAYNKLQLPPGAVNANATDRMVQ